MAASEKAAYSSFSTLLTEYTGFLTTVNLNGSFVEFKIRQVPVYGSRRKDVTVEIPRGRLDNSYKFAIPLMPNEFRIMAGTKAFPHPHVWDRGNPCWGQGNCRDLTTLFSIIVRTLTWENVTATSRAVGHYTPNECIQRMGDSRESEIAKHKRTMTNAVRKQETIPETFFSQRFPKLLKERLMMA